MHELSVCRGLLRQVQAIARQRGAQRIKTIRLAIGPLANIDQALLQRAYQTASRATLAEGAALEIDTVPVRVRCQHCDAVSRASVQDLRCRHCGAWETIVESGHEMQIVHLELSVTGEAHHV
jgi:hydrogenase nickel incorporation protein HypA/HybF